MTAVLFPPLKITTAAVAAAAEMQAYNGGGVSFVQIFQAAVADCGGGDGKGA